MKKQLALFLQIILPVISFCQQAPVYLIDSPYTADASVHVFNNTIFIYPSHDIETGIRDGKDGAHYNMADYHVFSMDSINGKVKDHGVVLALLGIPWAGKQLWAPDCAFKKGTYYLYFPAKDRNGVFKTGVAISRKPQGPFKAKKEPIAGSYSIDPAVFKATDGNYYMYFGGISGGQLHWYRNNTLTGNNSEPTKDSNALCPKIAKLSSNMLSFAEAPRDVAILDKNRMPLKAGDHDRRFFEGAWLHQYNGKYYLSYSTGNTHKLVYAMGDDPYGPFIFEGEILSPVTGWTTHHSIVEIKGKWYLFYHDTKRSGKNYLRSVKYRPLQYNADGSIQAMNGLD